MNLLTEKVEDNLESNEQEYLQRWTSNITEAENMLE